MARLLLFFFLLLGFSLHIESGFTLTDLVDFAPIATVAVGLVGIDCLARFGSEKASPPLVTLLLLLSFWPVASTVALYFLASEVVAKFGHWPIAMIDDPKNMLGNVSARYDALFHLVNYVEAFAGAWMIVHLALYFTLKARFSGPVRRLSWGIAAVSFLVFLFEPGGLGAWWMD